MKNKRTISRKEGLWKESVSYLAESRNYVYVLVILFFLSALVGFVFWEHFDVFNDTLRELGDKIDGLDQAHLTWFILQNNVTSAFVSMVLGVFSGIIPIFNAVLNGTLLGYVYALASAEAGFEVIFLLVPHGLFELPAVLIALGLGVKLGAFLFAPRGKKFIEFKRRFWGSMRVFFTMILPLLIIAAIIEGMLISSSG